MTSQVPDLELVCFDLAGTTVADGGVVLASFHAALDQMGVSDEQERATMERFVVETMGQSKIDVFTALFGERERAEAANSAFEAAYGQRAGRVEPLPGAEEVLKYVRKAGRRTALLTGFSAATRDRVIGALGWDGIADVVLCPSEAGRGRPWPDLVLVAGLRAGVGDVAAVAVVGDTAADMESGRRAGSPTRLGVLTGTHDQATLLRGGATRVLASVESVPGALGL